MPRPGTDIEIVDAAVPSGAILDTGQAFFAGAAAQGPTAAAASVSGIQDYERQFGSRNGGSLLYDSVNAFFAEGGGTLYISRISGPNAVAAAAVLDDVDVEATSPGVWANGLKVDVIAPPAGYTDGVTLTVSKGTDVLERSPRVTTLQQMVAWADRYSNLVVFDVSGATDVPVVGTNATLAAGADDNTWDDTTVGDALARFDYAFGPGQVAVPGHTDDATHTALLDHVESKRRVAVMDLVDSDDPTELIAGLEGVQDNPATRFALAVAPWALYPGPGGATVTIPYSGIQCGLIAAADRGGNPNQPAAGVNGVSRYALGLSNDFTDDDREVLNEVGIAMAKVKYNQVRTYGYRTAAGPLQTNWLWFGNSRLVMAVAHECDAVAENYVLRQIDGRRGIFAALQSDLKGVCLPYFNSGALYGETPQDAFSVDTGPSVNPIDTIKNGEIHAVVRLRCSPAAEWVQIDIVKVPVEVSLAPAGDAAVAA